MATAVAGELSGLQLRSIHQLLYHRRIQAQAPAIALEQQIETLAFAVRAGGLVPTRRRLGAGLETWQRRQYLQIQQVDDPSRLRLQMDAPQQATGCPLQRHDGLAREIEDIHHAVDAQAEAAAALTNHGDPPRRFHRGQSQQAMTVDQGQRAPVQLEKTEHPGRRAGMRHQALRPGHYALQGLGGDGDFQVTDPHDALGLHHERGPPTTGASVVAASSSWIS